MGRYGFSKGDCFERVSVADGRPSGCCRIPRGCSRTADGGSAIGVGATVVVVAMKEETGSAAFIIECIPTVETADLQGTTPRTEARSDDDCVAGDRTVQYLIRNLI